jgi:hypothetical protein
MLICVTEATKMNEMLTLVITLGGLVFIGSFAMLMHRLLLRVDATENEAEWLDCFAVQNYLPMERLLDRSDYEFLKAQPGYRPEIARRLRADRRKIFCEYLRRLVRDFNQLIGIAKLMMVNSDVDRPDLARAISRQRNLFYLNVLAIECRLVLQPLGVPQVDVRGLLNSLQVVHTELVHQTQ